MLRHYTFVIFRLEQKNHHSLGSYHQQLSVSRANLLLVTEVKRTINEIKLETLIIIFRTIQLLSSFQFVSTEDMIGTLIYSS